MPRNQKKKRFRESIKDPQNAREKKHPTSTGKKEEKDLKGGGAGEGVQGRRGSRGTLKGESVEGFPTRVKSIKINRIQEKFQGHSKKN